MRRTIISLLTGLWILLSAVSVWGQQKKAQYIKLPVAFYNLENLFDTIQSSPRDNEFIPTGKNAWTSERYMQKISNMARVISGIGGSGPVIIGVSEVENRGVLEDLVRDEQLAPLNYSIVHYDSPDYRGIDCAILYNPKVFNVVSTGIKPVKMPDNPNFLTRDIVFATGTIAGEVFHIIVGHWPSRAGGEVPSIPKRMQAALTMKSVADSLLAAYPNSNAIMMGDFNDDPVSPSVRDGLEVKDYPDNVGYMEYYTPMLRLYNQGQGTLAYRDVWNLFDIMVVNGALLGDDISTFKLLKDPETQDMAFIYKKNFMLQQSGRYKGYPLRTMVAGQYRGGYSDHFPVYLYLVKEIKR